MSIVLESGPSINFDMKANVSPESRSPRVA